MLSYLHFMVFIILCQENVFRSPPVNYRLRSDSNWELPLVQIEPKALRILFSQKNDLIN